MLDAVSGRNSLLTFTFTARLEPSRPLTAEEIGNVIEAMVDDLDPKVIDPSVSATGCETVVEVEVAATLDPGSGDLWSAMQVALSAVQDAFRVAVPADAGLTSWLDVRSAPVVAGAA